MNCPHCGYDVEDNPRDVEIYKKLAPQHRQALRLLIFGMHPKEIAKQMGVKYDTVRGYLHFCFLRTGMDSRTSLIAFVVRRPDLLRLIKEPK